MKYIPKPLKTVGVVMEKIMSLFLSNATKPTRVNNVHRGRKESRKPKIAY